MSLSWDLTKLLNCKCFPCSVVNVLSSCCAAGQVPCITVFHHRRGIFSSACLARKHEICCANHELAVVPKSQLC